MVQGDVFPLPIDRLNNFRVRVCERADLRNFCRCFCMVLRGL